MIEKKQAYASGAAAKLAPTHANPRRAAVGGEIQVEGTRNYAKLAH